MPAAPREGFGAAHPAVGRRAARRAATAALGVLAERVRPTYLAQEEILPTSAPLAELLGTPGLRRGSTLLVEAAWSVAPKRRDLVSGATSLALALLAEPSTAGASCAVVGLPDLGLAAAGELGVALGRLVVVPSPGVHVAGVVASLLEGVDLVLACFPDHVPAALARRLAARARERRSILVLAGRGVGELTPLRADLIWPEPPDARLSVLAAEWDLGDGSGTLFTGRRLEVRARRRRAAPEEVHRVLTLSVTSGRLRLSLATSKIPVSALSPPTRQASR